MKVGDLVVPAPSSGPTNRDNTVPMVEDGWAGIIIDVVRWPRTDKGLKQRLHPVVYWNEEFSAEEEYPEQIQVIQEREK